MSCEIKIKSLDFLKEKGAIGKGRVVQDIDTFNELNDALTLLASEKYGVVSPSNDKLFKSESKYVKNLDGSYRYILRAEPNEKLFNTLQVAVDNYGVLETKFNTVDYSLKAIEILNSDTAKQIFDKGNKNNWTLDKILTELQISKEQKQLILNILNTENIKINEKVLNKSLKDFKKPILNLKFVSDKVLLEKDNALELKYKQDSIKEEFKEFKKVITCLWK